MVYYYCKASALMGDFDESGRFVIEDDLINDPINDPINGPISDPIKPDERESAVIGLLRSEPGITRAKMAKALGSSESTSKRMIQAMVSKNVTRRIGSNKKGEWIIQ